MKISLLMCLAAISCFNAISATESAEIIQTFGVGIGVDGGPGVGVGVDVGPGYYNDGNYYGDNWTGPGWYGGYWYSNQDDYDYWYRNYRRDGREGYRYRDRDRRYYRQ